MSVASSNADVVDSRLVCGNDGDAQALFQGQRSLYPSGGQSHHHLKPRSCECRIFDTWIARYTPALKLFSPSVPSSFVYLGH